VLTAILPRCLASIFVYHALLEALASEQQRTMVSMKSASDKAEELTGEFTLQFKQSAASIITREVSRDHRRHGSHGSIENKSHNFMKETIQALSSNYRPVVDVYLRRTSAGHTQCA